MNDPRTNRFKRENRRGSVLIFVIGLIVVAGTMAASLTAQSLNKLVQGDRLRNTLALQNLVESGRARARAELATSAAYRGADRLKLGRGELRIRVIPDGDGFRIHVLAAMPDLENPRKTETFEEIWKPEGRHEETTP